MLHITNETYKPPKERILNIESFTYIRNESDDFFALYVDIFDKRFILGARGTVPKNPYDVLNDLVISFHGGCDYPRVSTARSIMSRASKKYPGYKRYITGHSLGGGVARCIALNDVGIEAITFNAAAPPTSLASQVGANVTSYHIVLDLISAWLGAGSEKTFRFDMGHKIDSSVINTLGPTHSASNFFNQTMVLVTKENENQKWQDWYKNKAPVWFVTILQSIVNNEKITPDFIIKSNKNRSIRELP
jgi:hypothetical protein